MTVICRALSLDAADGYIFALRSFPKSGSRLLHAATICGSICGNALVACFRCGEPAIMGRMQSTMIPAPSFAPLGTKPARVHAAVIWAQGCRRTG